jgi:aminopeptidase-like protein|tara:strand:- start:19213 stop:20493 length:1281 start_codon:yes stop_codon:yes gene_type:complete
MIGTEIHNLATKLWSINRSITGEGVRKTLQHLKNEYLPTLNIESVPSGTKVFDWVVPPEWHVSKAYIITPEGKKVCNFSDNNLHLVGYSIPFHGKMQLEELQKYLYSLPEQTNAIPYITSYYKKRWGFCLTQEQRDGLKEGEYEIVIDSKLFSGQLNYGELILPGESDQEIFLSTYICHPSMANNELSGPTVATYLAKWLSELSSRRYTYRFIFIPETIGSITYLSKNHKHLKRKVIAGFNVSCVGDDRSYSYVPSRNGNTLSDMVAKHVLKSIEPDYKSYTWLDRGSDERQYCAPGIDLPIATILRTKYGQYPEYHTSLDNLYDVVTPRGLDGGYWALRKALELIEKNKIYKTNILCEPQLGKRGLYPTLSTKTSGEEIRVMMNFLSFCDGEHLLLDIAEKLNLPAWDLYELVEKLVSHDLISST